MTEPAPSDSGEEQRHCTRCGHSKGLHFRGSGYCYADLDGRNCGCSYYGSLGDRAPKEDIEKRLEPEPRGQKAAHYSSLADSQR